MKKQQSLNIYYQILNIPENAAKDEIKTAYRKLCKEYHPDISNGESTGKMALINEAYHALMGKIDNPAVSENNNNLQKGMVPHKDQAYAFYKEGLRYYNGSDINMSANPNHLTVNRKRMFDKTNNLQQLEQRVLKSLYYFNIICMRFSNSVWYEDSIEKIRALNRRRAAILKWKG